MDRLRDFDNPASPAVANLRLERLGHCYVGIVRLSSPRCSVSILTGLLYLCSIGFKVNGGQIPSRYGPIRRLVTSLLRVHRTQSDQEGTSIARDDVISYKAQMGHCRQSSVKAKPEIVTPRNHITTSFMHRQ